MHTFALLPPCHLKFGIKDVMTTSTLDPVLHRKRLVWRDLSKSMQTAVACGILSAGHSTLVWSNCGSISTFYPSLFTHISGPGLSSASPSLAIPNLTLPLLLGCCAHGHDNMAGKSGFPQLPCRSRSTNRLSLPWCPATGQTHQPTPNISHVSKTSDAIFYTTAIYGGL